MVELAPALVYEGPWSVGLRPFERPPSPGPGEALVRIKATGICGTDLGIISGAYAARKPVVLGHESTGEVVAVGGAVRGLAPGDRVVIDPTYFCGICRMCRTGRSNHCERKTSTETGVSRDGTFAPLYLTEERFLYRLPDHVGYEEATLTEPLSCTLTGVARLRLRPDLRLLVLGGGPMGVLYANALALHGLTGALVEIAQARRHLLPPLLPAGIQPCADLDQALTEASCQGVFDVIVDTTGCMAETALRHLPRGGQLLLVGLRAGNATFDPRRIADESLAILGSIDSLGTFSAALELIANGTIPARAMISATFPLAEFDIALASLGCDLGERRRTDTASAVKVVLHP